MAICLSNKISYSGRLFLWLLLYSLLLVSGIIIFQYHREKEFRAELLNAQLQLVNAQIITELSKGTSPDDIRPDGVPLSDELRVSVISPAGEVVYDNALDSIGGSNHLDRAEIRSALSHGSGYAERRHSKTTGTNYFYSATRGSNGYIVRTAVPYTISLDSLLEADYGFIWVIGVLTAVMCALGYIASRKVGLHIQRLRKFAQNVENGERISDTEPFPHDELGEISNHIVRLYAMLQQANADRDREHRSAMREHQEKERIKKQLTNNINHELKTPVASIQICLETLLAHRTMSEEKKEMFLRRSLMNTERLKRLLNDVSAITRMDDGGRTILKEAQNLTEIIRTAVDEYGTLAAAKGIALECNIPDKITVTGNQSLLESVFNNLLDNSIAYSDGTKIEIDTVAAPSGKIQIRFRDNGRGVPEIHLPHLFERFYRIDKGRSRAAGGTGLGLAIVKNAVLLHGGTISVENGKEGGLLFLISFPLSQ